MYSEHIVIFKYLFFSLLYRLNLGNLFWCGQFQNAHNLQLQRTCSPVPKTVKTNSFSQQIESRVRCIGYESNKGRCSGGRLPGAPQCDWPSLEARNAPQNLNRPNLRGLLLNGSGGVKRECAGTGVFLPRRYENSAPESRKRSGV